jgi:Tfp pilus assembly protein PilV
MRGTSKVLNVRDMRRRLRHGAGYTLVELMMSLSVFVLGVAGIVGMQKVAISSNQHGKNLAMATHLAQSWLDELAADAGQWNESSDFDEAPWLAKVGAEGGAPSAWFRPDYNTRRRFGPAFDALGNAVATADMPADAHFCTDVRLTWLYGQIGSKEGGGLIRAQVRVFFRKEGMQGIAAPPEHACDITPQEFDAGGDGLYHVVYLSTALRQTFMDE